MVVFRDPERSVLLHVSTGSVESRHLQAARAECRSVLVAHEQHCPRKRPARGRGRADVRIALHLPRAGPPPELGARSEEHTSELQSLMRSSYAVFCLKKKKTKK